MWNRAVGAALACALLGGCGGQVAAPAAQLRKPEARLMVAPPTLPAVAAGTDSYRSDATCSAAYGEQADKLRSLQTYVSTATKKR